MEIRFHPQAELELSDSAMFYEEQVTGLGSRFLSSVENALTLLGTHPYAGQALQDDLQRISLKKFPYSIIYTIEPDMLWILAVAHESRRPGYWKNRTKRK